MSAAQRAPGGQRGVGLRRFGGACAFLAAGGLALLSLDAAAVHAQAAGSATPDVSDRDQQARLRFEQGRAAYGDGRYRDAWAHFHEAYQLSGRPELLFNIGQTADRLGQEGDAVKAFTMYLQRLPDAPNRRDVENRVRALRERIALTQQASAPAPSAPTRGTPLQPSAAPAKSHASPTSLAAPAPTPAKPRDPRRGFYLHAALGAGYRADAISQTTDEGLLGQSTSDYASTGYGLALDLGVGWGVLPGFVVGGGLFLDWTSAPTLSEEGADDTQLSATNLTTVGPFIDWYPVRKTLGWHILSGFGIGVLRYKDKPNNQDFTGTAYGISFLVGTGYDFNLGATTALGIELRLMGAALAESVDMETTSHGMFSPSLLASFTWF